MTIPGSADFIPVGHFEHLTFSFVHVAHAASALGYITVEEFEIVISSLHRLHVYRVYRLKKVMELHEPDGNGMPRPVREAVQDLKEVEGVFGDLQVPRLEPAILRARLEEMEATASIAIGAQ